MKSWYGWTSSTCPSPPSAECLSPTAIRIIFWAPPGSSGPWAPPWPSTGTFTVAACAETLAHVRTICEMILGKKMTKYFDKQILFREVTDGEQLNLAGFDIQAFDIGSKKMKQFGFRLALPDGEHVCFAGDEPVKPSTEKYARDAKWLFSEAYCLYADRDIYKPYERSHVTSLDVGSIAREMNVKNLLIYHTEDYGPDRRERMTQEAGSVYSGHIFVPEDMETVEL